MEYIYNIDVSLSGESRFEYVPAVQGDIKSRYLKITLYADSQIFIVPDNVIAILRCKRRDGLIILSKCTLNNDGSLIAMLTNQMLAKAGDLKCEIALYDSTDNSRLTSTAFTVKVHAALTSETQIPDDDNDDDVENKEGLIAFYEKGGTLPAGEPKNDNHVTTKKYVDDKLDGKLNKVASDIRVYPGVYATESTDGTPQLITATSDLSYIGTGGGYIPLYAPGGQLKTATPTADDSAANKAYVDAVKADLADKLKAANKPYELIETITLTEATNLIERNTEPDGTAYSFAKVLITVDTPKTDTAAQQNVRLYINDGTLDYYAYYQSLTTYAKRAHFDCAVENGLLKIRIGNGATNYGGENTGVAAMIENANIVFLSAINKIKLKGEVTFAVGTVIKIYGVRA